MTLSGFAAQLAEDLDPEDLRMVLGVFCQDVGRLTGLLDSIVVTSNVAAFRRTCHALAGAAGAVGAAPLEQACRDAMTSPDLSPVELPAARTHIQALGAAVLEEAASYLAALPEG